MQQGAPSAVLVIEDAFAPLPPVEMFWADAMSSGISDAEVIQTVISSESGTFYFAAGDELSRELPPGVNGAAYTERQLSFSASYNTTQTLLLGQARAQIVYTQPADAASNDTILLSVQIDDKAAA